MLKVDQLNTLDRQEFTHRLAGVFEHSPWIAARTAGKRPFVDRSALYTGLRQTVMQATSDEKLALIRAHPDLVGQFPLTDESAAEQRSAGLGALTSEEVELFRKYNAAYQARFGFPFVICARLNKKEAILDAFPIRLQNSKEEEMETALNEIFKIAQLRLEDLVE